MRRVLETRHMLRTSTLVVALCMSFTGMAYASSTVEAGFDLLRHVSSSFDFGTVPNPQTVDFEGLPLGCFDFGAGCVSTGDTDTIVERITLANLGGGSDTIDIEIVALSLVSIDPVDLGFGAGFEDLFITLNTSSPSLQSTMTIFDAGEGSPHGTFDSELNFSFDVTGGVGGFYGTIGTTNNSSGNDWQHAPTGVPLIDGTNHLLDGSTENGDFWLDGTAVYNGILGEVRAVPEPGTALLVGLGLVGLAAGRRRKR